MKAIRGKTAGSAGVVGREWGLRRRALEERLRGVGGWD
jgi:hypothetical protein